MSLISPRAAVVALATTLAATFALPAVAQSPTTMRIAGNFSANGKHTGGIEKPFFEAFAKNTGLTITRTTTRWMCWAFRRQMPSACCAPALST